MLIFVILSSVKPTAASRVLLAPVACLPRKKLLTKLPCHQNTRQLSMNSRLRRASSVAVKRYAQAQAALKDKDYGGYVKNKQKSMKAADATIPKSGWSPGRRQEERRNRSSDFRNGKVSSDQGSEASRTKGKII